jgi:hypothetical protein
MMDPIIIRAEDEAERQIEEVRRCTYGDYRLAIDACTAKLQPVLSQAEIDFIEKFRKKADCLGTSSLPGVVSRALLFDDPWKYMGKRELSALVKLVRRGRVRVERLVMSYGPQRLRYTLA